MKQTLALLALIAFTATASTQTVPQTESGLQQFKEKYNNQTEKVPGFVGSIIGGETVNVNFKTNESTETFGVKFDGVKIQNISRDRYQDYTLEVNVTETAVSAVLESGQPYQELRQQLDSNNIRYEARNITTGIKLTVMGTLADLASMIGLNF